MTDEIKGAVFLGACFLGGAIYTAVVTWLAS